MPTNSHPLMSATQVADVFGVSRQTVARWASEGVLPAIRLPSGRFRFRRQDIEELLQMGEIA